MCKESHHLNTVVSVASRGIVAQGYSTKNIKRLAISLSYAKATIKVLWDLRVRVVYWGSAVLRREGVCVCVALALGASRGL